jgi:hypothetical protein
MITFTFNSSTNRRSLTERIHFKIKQNLPLAKIDCATLTVIVSPSLTPIWEIGSLYPCLLYRCRSPSSRYPIHTKTEVGESCDVWCLLMLQMMWPIRGQNIWKTFPGSEIQYSNDGNQKIIGNQWEKQNAQSIIGQEFAQCTMYIYAETVLQINLQGDFTCKPRGTIWIASTQMGRFYKTVRWGGWAAWPEAKSNSKGAIRLESTHIRWFSIWL